MIGASSSSRLGLVRLVPLAALAALVGGDRLPRDEVTVGTLLGDAADLNHLTLIPRPAYRTILFSSHDRRSRTPGSPDWFANNDGFGGEPIPGFQRVLREPRDGGVGRYLVCDVLGPGAIVRTWSADNYGALRVWLDDKTTPLYDGPARAFLNRKAEHFAEEAGIDPQDLKPLEQRYADYLPIPFARHLRIEWEGKLSLPHFYHVTVRTYANGTAVRPFRSRQLRRQSTGLRQLALRLSADSQPLPRTDERDITVQAPLGPRQRPWSLLLGGPGAIRRLLLRIAASDRSAAVRSTVLRIWFDDAPTPQIESPLGDFFVSVPGVTPYSTLPVTVRSDGAMVSRFVMPFASSARLELDNRGAADVRVSGSVRFADQPWDPSRSMHFHALWRVDRGLNASGDPARAFDLNWVTVQGEGRYVGTSMTLANPARAPSAWGNWWGEGDEKVFVDGEATPSIFGTGSEDYFNYAWSDSAEFGSAYAALPWVTGPGHRGYVSNVRWQILDDVPFARALRFDMELLHHDDTKDVSVARIGYYYARPGARVDASPLRDADLVIDPLPIWRPAGVLGSKGAIFFEIERQELPDTGRVELVRSVAYGDGTAVLWHPRGPGDRFDVPFDVASEGVYLMALVGSPEIATNAIALEVDGVATRENIPQQMPLKFGAADTPRLRTRVLLGVALRPGSHTLSLISTTPLLDGVVLDLLWLRAQPTPR